MTAGVFVCACAFCRCPTSRSTPHLPRWFRRFAAASPPPLPSLSRPRHISPPDRMTAHLWPIVTPDAQSFGRPVEVAINPATRRTPGPLGYPTLTKPLSFFSLISHPRVPSATLDSLNYSSVYISCQALQKNVIKCAEKTGRREPVWCKDTYWIGLRHTHTQKLHNCCNTRLFLFVYFATEALLLKHKCKRLRTTSR